MMSGAGGVRRSQSTPHRRHCQARRGARKETCVGIRIPFLDQPPRVRAARIVAIVADFIQIAALPMFAGGWLSPLNDVLDVVVALVLLRLVGWHVAFLPSFIAEFVPGLDLIP